MGFDAWRLTDNVNGSRTLGYFQVRLGSSIGFSFSCLCKLKGLKSVIVPFLFKVTSLLRNCLYFWLCWVFIVAAIRGCSCGAWALGSQASVVAA